MKKAYVADLNCFFCYKNSFTQSDFASTSSTSVTRVHTAVFSHWVSTHIQSFDKKLNSTGKYNILLECEGGSKGRSKLHLCGY